MGKSLVMSFTCSEIDDKVQKKHDIDNAIEDYPIGLGFGVKKANFHW